MPVVKLQRSMLVLHDDAAKVVKKIPAVIHVMRLDPKIVSETGYADYRDGMPHNPSIAIHNGKLFVNIRVVFLAHRTTQNFLSTLDSDWRLRGTRLLKDKSGGSRNGHGLSIGLEDLRLFSWNSKLFASATACDRIDGDPRPKIAVLELDGNGDILRVNIQDSNRHEKNWMPFIDGDKLRFIYSTSPRVVLDYDEKTREVVPPVMSVPFESSVVRGGSQLIPYEDGFLGVIHEVHRHPVTGYAYLHRFAYFDRDIQLVRMSDVFYFCEVGTEFCAGLVEWQGNFVASFGAGDREACLAVIHRDVVRRMVNP